MSILYDLGEYGPILLTILSWYLLWDNKKLIFYYTIGIFTNSVLNIILKGIIREPRPMFDNTLVKLLDTHGKTYFYKNGIPFYIFGMPSGHAQSCQFSTVFIFMSLKRTNLLFIYIPLSLLTFYQRVKFDYHSINQVIIGAFIGAIVGYLVYNLARENVKNHIREKPDDNGPL